MILVALLVAGLLYVTYILFYEIFFLRNVLYCKCIFYFRHSLKILQIYQLNIMHFSALTHFESVLPATREATRDKRR